jgi:hypothetical protein
MNEYEALVSILREQQKKLLLIISEAEEKIEIFTKAITEGRKQLNKVEEILKAMRPN